MDFDSKLESKHVIRVPTEIGEQKLPKSESLKDLKKACTFFSTKEPS